MQHHSLREAVKLWRKSPLLMVILMVELALFVSAVWAAAQPPVSYTFTPEQLEPIASEDVTLSYDENGYYGVTYDIDGQDILQTPELTLVPGTYEADVIYSYSPTRTVEGRIHHSNVQLVDAANELSVAEGALVLDENRTEQTVLMSVYQPTDTARVIFHNDGGKYTVGGITLTQDMGYAALCALWVLVCWLAVDGVLLCILPASPFYRGGGPAAAFVILTGAVILASSPLLTEGIDLTCADSIFHLQRIEGIAQGLKDGQFPVRLNSEAKNGYGYANSMFYGELFLYIPACLRLLGTSVQDAYKFYAVGIHAATALISYLCFKPIFGRKEAIFGAAIYVMSPYRLHKYYDLYAVGEYTALTFLPAIAYALWLLYHGEPGKVERRRAMTVLALSYTALLQCHMITTELAIIAGAAVALIFWRKTFRLPILLTWLKAAGLAFLLNLWFLVPFITLMLSGEYARMISRNIQWEGLTLAKLFSLTNGSTVGLPLLIGGGLTGCILLMYREKKQPWYRIGCISLAIGSAAVWLSTRLFPWNAITGIPVLGVALQSIQFPWRYSAIATIALIIACMAATKLLSEEKCTIPQMSVLTFCTAASLMVLSIYSGDIIAAERTTTLVDTSQLCYTNNYTPTSNIYYSLDNLYLPAGVETNQDGFVYNEIVTSVNLGDFTRENGVTSVEYSEYLGQDGHIEFPLLYYPGYKIIEGTGSIFKTANGMVGVLVPANSEGTISVAFREPLRWRLADLVSLTTVAALAGSAVMYRFRRKKRAVSG